jgi:putative glutathione S-transferase
MGQLVDGHWVVQEVNPQNETGEFKRQPTKFRHAVEASRTARFTAESGRYHLYVSLACPWAHRTLIFRYLKGLTPHIDVSVVHYLMGDDGWSFEPGPGVISDPVIGAKFLRDIYLLADPRFTGRVTVPVLWDKQEGTIVNNESSEIIRIFNSAFDKLTDNRLDLYPQPLRPRIDAFNQKIYDNINNGVYKAGFARTQEAYDVNVTALFATLDEIETHLGQSLYLVGDQITEADWRLFTTLVRFDAVYVGHFKCNVRRIADYPHLHNYLKALYQIPGIAKTCDFNHIKKHYYESHETINPTRIVPLGPELDLTSPHNRG